jgi:hypothetical protein
MQGYAGICRHKHKQGFSAVTVSKKSILRYGTTSKYPPTRMSLSHSSPDWSGIKILEKKKDDIYLYFSKKQLARNGIRGKMRADSESNSSAHLSMYESGYLAGKPGPCSPGMTGNTIMPQVQGKCTHSLVYFCAQSITLC